MQTVSPVYFEGSSGSYLASMDSKRPPERLAHYNANSNSRPAAIWQKGPRSNANPNPNPNLPLVLWVARVILGLHVFKKQLIHNVLQSCTSKALLGFFNDHQGSIPLQPPPQPHQPVQLHQPQQDRVHSKADVLRPPDVSHFTQNSINTMLSKLDNLESEVYAVVIACTVDSTRASTPVCRADLRGGALTQGAQRGTLMALGWCLRSGA